MTEVDCEQGTPEWFEARKGRMTASHAQQIGNVGKGLTTYIRKLMCELYSSAEREQFSNEHTERGHEYEATARMLYELERGVTVREVGFIKYGKYAGCSPDGLVGEDGGLEIKSIDDDGYFDHLIDGEAAVESKHLWQCQMNMLVTGRKWWDLVIYNPNLSPSMVVYRILPDAKKMDALKAGIKAGEAMIKEIKSKLDAVQKDD